MQKGFCSSQRGPPSGRCWKCSLSASWDQVHHSCLEGAEEMLHVVEVVRP